ELNIGCYWYIFILNQYFVPYWQVKYGSERENKLHGVHKICDKRFNPFNSAYLFRDIRANSLDQDQTPQMWGLI
ncbi:MAG: hypothetical protein AB2693_19425, partial [Candidatus Thiodiazotropha sp.]